MRGRKNYFPKKEGVSFHDKTVLAIGAAIEENEQLKEELKERKIAHHLLKMDKEQLIREKFDLIKETNELKEQRDELMKLAENLLHMEPCQGREGCTYGDTNYDSESAAKGYNDCLRDVKEKIEKSINSSEAEEDNDLENTQMRNEAEINSDR